MKTYEVFGTIEMNFSTKVSADNEEEARKLAKENAEDGSIDFGPSVGEAEISEVRVLNKK